MRPEADACLRHLLRDLLAQGRPSFEWCVRFATLGTSHQEILDTAWRACTRGAEQVLARLELLLGGAGAGCARIVIASAYGEVDSDEARAAFAGVKAAGAPMLVSRPVEVRECWNCDGFGHVGAAICRYCSGSGFLKS